MKKYVYKTIVLDTTGVLGGKIDVAQFDHALNEMGCDGWELTEMTASNQSYGSTRYILCVFKRELNPS